MSLPQPQGNPHSSQNSQPSPGNAATPVKGACVMQIRPFHSDDQEAVISLWRRCNLVRAWNDPAKDIHRKLQIRPDLFLVGLIGGQIIGSVMAGYEGHRGWLNYLAVDPEHQRQGYARAIVDEAERLLREAGCPKINLQVRTSNHEVIEFYRRIGYSDDEVVSLGKRLEHDEKKLQNGKSNVEC